MFRKQAVTIAIVALAALTLTGCTLFMAASPPNEAPQEEPLPPAEERSEGEALMDLAEEEVQFAEAAPGAAALMPSPLPTAAALAAPQAGEMPVDMFFQDYGTNPFIDASADNLSTFAVDVDTGSYTLARSYINGGYLPPSEAIRVEEFVNYFEQDYPVPQDRAFNIIMDAAPTPFSESGSFVMRVGIQGYDIPQDARPAANLIFVIDVSGSMEGPERLGAVKHALTTLVENLRPTDSIGIVVYGSVGRKVLEPTPVAERATILRAIESLQSEGSTNAEEGLRLAYEMATAHYRPGSINRLILCSDGVANVGATGPDVILQTVRQQARDGITLTTVGFGMGNFNDVLMEQLADDGDGQYYYVDTQNEAARIFTHGLTGTLLTIARDAKIQVEFNTDVVRSYRLIGYENRDVADQDFRNDAVDAGEIGAGHSVTALYEVVPLQGAGGIVATARLRWADPESGEVTEIEQSLDSSQIARSFEQAPVRFRLDVAVAAFADRLGQGPWAQSAGTAGLAQMVQELASGELANDNAVVELADLIVRANSIQ